jgi:hypothetical protein
MATLLFESVVNIPAVKSGSDDDDDSSGSSDELAVSTQSTPSSFYLTAHILSATCSFPAPRFS